VEVRTHWGDTYIHTKYNVLPNHGTRSPSGKVKPVDLRLEREKKRHLEKSLSFAYIKSSSAPSTPILAIEENLAGLTIPVHLATMTQGLFLLFFFFPN
jgi:hypothetical protein